jgi:hypothetical protein
VTGSDDAEARRLYLCRARKALRMTARSMTSRSSAPTFGARWTSAVSSRLARCDAATSSAAPPGEHQADHGPRQLFAERQRTHHRHERDRVDPHGSARPATAPVLHVDAVSVFGGVEIKHEK